ncbi:hypothetical protein [Clostridium kluyveri]|uniref:Uncharacterized protein n=1 Tax=Clostridium kluyveri (strain ATCC 8527 / DSM 555 / NBRC 12016 / NCIMB 10680 / K1) TaxID=431943 RepID=A5N1G3_CLOK5|nr:hypothetical protein [Clostridium kluyveri]EDK34959.1 Hypothetical protein CKL_2950 [Clostridium kluyveri DSM 555]
MKLEPVIQEKAKENLKTSTGGKNPLPCQKSDNPAINRKKELAQIAGVSHDTIHKVKIIENKGSEERKCLHESN